MKKFLSLLLALTLVLSLVVVPARAADDATLTPSEPTTIEKGSSTTVQITAASGKEFATGYPKWEIKDGSSNFVELSGDAGATSATVTGKAVGTATIVCKYQYAEASTEVKTTSNQDASSEQTKELSITVNDSAGLKAAISGITFNSRSVSLSGEKLYYFSDEEAGLATSNNWIATLVDSSGYSVSSTSYDKTKHKLTVTATKDGATVTAVYDVPAEQATVTVTAKPTTIAKTTGIATITASAPTISGVKPAYTWTGVTATGNTATLTSVTASTQVTCEASYTFGQSNTKKISNTATIIPDEKTYEWTGLPIGTLNMAKGDTNTTTLPGIKLVTSGTSNAPNDVAYSYVSSNPSAVTVIDNSDGSKAIKAVGSGYATITITAKDKTATDTNYRGLAKPYTTAVTVSSTALEYSLGSVTNGSGAHPYSYDTLCSYAAYLINTRLGNGSNLGYNDVTSLTVKSGSLATLGGSFAPAIGPLTSAGLTYTAPNASIGKASITLTAATARGNFDIAYNISVTPISWTFETVTAEPIVSNSAYYNNTYKVTFPTTTFNQFYVVNKTGVAPADYSSYNLITGTTSTTLNASDFNATTGTCTLFVIAWNSNYNYNWSTGYAGKYYCGPMTVSQTNYNINYNGVAGETVQFKHADFTNFMNEVSQARGDASKTGSYPYVTFNYVTFNYPTSTQGTLYYNGTAMSNSSYSGSFNSSTQITNLDNVTFVPYARTSAKSIPLTFTLSVTKYGANGAVVNRDLKYTGTVVVSIVREDIKYTAAPGDTIRFSDSDFLSYLRTQNGFNSNYYSIDYVTFDQSAVNALSEGVLYSYYSGYNAVKTTDKFYYTTTSYNQNALSDVTFRASAYAKTGTTGTGTRQVSGTVAIKIAQTMNFVDVKPTDYFYDSVKWAVNSNITKGTSATTFSPYKTCTRAEIVTFLWRDAGSPMPTITRSPFTDVNYSMGADYYNAILWASQNGIAAGTSATTFSPNANCTRAQIVTFLWRYAKKPLGYYTNPFTDVNKTEHAAYYDAILWAVGKGITKGSTATTFSPYGTCTRGEAVTFLYRYENGTK